MISNRSDSQFSERFYEALEALWASLFSSPVHLDAALSRTPSDLKSYLAEFVPVLLRRPVALGRTLGISERVLNRVWDLSPEELQDWEGVSMIASRFLELCALDSKRLGETKGVPNAARKMLRKSEEKASSEDFPIAWVEEWKAEWGEERAERLCRVLAGDPPVGLRASRRIGSDRMLSALADQLELPRGSALSQLVPSGVVLPEYAPVLGTSLASDGVLEIQDEGSQFMAHFTLWPELFADRLSDMPAPASMTSGAATSISGLKAGAPIVVDACAGAGGKSLALADLMDGRGRVFAYDVSAKKLMALRKRAKKSRMNSIQAVELEEGRESESLIKFKGTADIVLVDAPCSGFGILRRSPDIKWKSEPSDMSHLPEIQLRLLNLYADLVRPGGRLVYGLCTFSREESIGVVSRFQEERKDFEPLQGGFLGPFAGSSDGFFMQAFGKTAGER